MTLQASYSEVRASFATYLDKAVQDRETVIIKRRGCDDVALIAADELRSLMELAHLVGSTRKAVRLFTALEEAHQGIGTPVTFEGLLRQTGVREDELGR